MQPQTDQKKSTKTNTALRSVCTLTNGKAEQVYELLTIKATIIAHFHFWLTFRNRERKR